MLTTEIYLKKIYKVVEDFIKSNNKNGIKGKISFRGESLPYGKTSLMPSIFRYPEFLNREQTLLALLTDYGVVDKTQSYITKAIDCQHYIARSRFLDITYSVLPALYFACENFDDKSLEGKSLDEKKGFVFIFNFPEFYSPNSPYIEDGYKTLLINKNSLYHKNFKVLTHIEGNKRIKAQSGGVIFFPGTEFSPIDNLYYKFVEIPFNHKKEIIKELDLFFNINAHTIYPDKDIDKYVKDKLIEFGEDEKTYYKEEVSCFVSRMQYEAKMKESMGIGNIEIARYLRREIDDFKLYFESFLKGKISEKETKRLFLKMDTLMEAYK